MKPSTLALLLVTTPIEGAPFYQVGVGFGGNNTKISNDLPHDFKLAYIDLGLGIDVAQYLKLSANLNAANYSGDLEGTVTTITPRIEFNMDSFYASLGVGIGHNSVKAEGYTHPWKWNLELSAGVQTPLDQLTNLKIGYKLGHLSHSFIGPWNCGGCHVGINTDNIEIAVRQYIRN